MKPKFGVYLCAMRHGMYWSEEHDSFIRISDWKTEDHFLVQMCTIDTVPTCLPKGSPAQHYVLQEYPEIRSLLNSSSALCQRRCKYVVSSQDENYGAQYEHAPTIEGYVEFVININGDEE